MNRREFLTTAGAMPALTALPGTVQAPAAGGSADRALWVGAMRRLADPVLQNLAAGTLKTRMPVEQAAGANRRNVTHLEALGRLLAGLAPWIELAADDTPEGRLRSEYADLARRAIGRAVDPASPDFMNFTRERQPLVDAAFLGQGILRAQRTLRDALDTTTKKNLIAALESTRAIAPPFNNWLLFSATVEAALAVLGVQWDRMRVDYALRQHDQWYKGDGHYGDGPSFHWDYYNSFVIHPMLIDVLAVCRDEMPAWKEMAGRMQERAARYAAIQERLISPEGTFPAIGRSIAYRFGAFHLLAQSALRRALPPGVAPAQVRGALGSVIKRSVDAPGTFDANGWLQVGFSGHQPGVGESYISTGSLYLCAVGLLPLGLPVADEFWASPPQPWTSVRAWGGQTFPIDSRAGDVSSRRSALGHARPEGRAYEESGTRVRRPDLQVGRRASGCGPEAAGRRSASRAGGDTWPVAVYNWQMQWILCVAILLVAGCSSSTAPTSPFSQELTVAAGTTASVTEGVTVRFTGVSGDSRCPGDAICIQGGDAVVNLQVISGDDRRDIELHTGSMQPVKSGNLTIELLQLMPYPFGSLPPIKPGDYRATIRVSR